MSESQSSKKSPHDLFREIDGLCEEIDRVMPNGIKYTEGTGIEGVLKGQEDRDKAKRKNDYAQLLSARLVDVEIQPFESPRDRAFLTVRSSVGSFRYSIDVVECFAFSEFLLSHDFSILATGKVRQDREPRKDESCVFTWFVFGKTGSC